jgi:hypothetical protein
MVTSVPRRHGATKDAKSAPTKAGATHERRKHFNLPPVIRIMRLVQTRARLDRIAAAGVPPSAVPAGFVLDAPQRRPGSKEGPWAD